MATATSTDTPASDFKILGLISVGHFMSHYYYLLLPPIFPQLKDAFGVGYTELGALLALMMGASAALQVPVGFWVDRFGARIVLAIGLIAISVCSILSGLAGSFWMLAVVTIILGLANAVFHPADYAILNSSVSEQRMGRAFSIHTFAGHLGSAAAPITIMALATAFGWRMALVISGLFGLAVVAAMATQWNVMREDKPKKEKKAERGDGMGLLLSKPMLVFFCFFALLSMVASGMQAFAVAALVNLHDTPLTVANTALSLYLFCSAAGILIGGEIADRTQRHDLVAAGVFLACALFSVLLGLANLPALALYLLMVIMGLGQGVTRPARDMMLRSAAPKGSVGKIFGFVSAGIASGSAIAPIPFGLILDAGRPDWVFHLMAVFMLIAVLTVFVPKQFPTVATAPKPAE